MGVAVGVPKLVCYGIQEQVPEIKFFYWQGLGIIIFQIFYLFGGFEHYSSANEQDIKKTIESKYINQTLPNIRQITYKYHYIWKWFSLQST